MRCDVKGIQFVTCCCVVRQVSTEFIADIKQKALQAGLSMGYLSSIGHFTGTVEEVRAPSSARLFARGALAPAAARMRQQTSRVATSHGVTVFTMAPS